MVTFNQQAGLLGQKANPAVSDTNQNMNRAGFPNAQAKPAQITGDVQRIQPAQGMQRLPPNMGPRTGPMIDPRTFGRPGMGMPNNGNLPGVGGVNGVQPGAFGRIEKGAWNDPNMRRGIGQPGTLPRPQPGQIPFPGGDMGRVVDPGFGQWPGQAGLQDAMARLRGGAAPPRQPMNPGGGAAPPQTPGGGAPWNPTANGPRPPMAQPNNGGGGITANGPGMAGGAAK